MKSNRELALLYPELVFLSWRGDDDEIVMFNRGTKVLTEVPFEVVHGAVNKLFAESLNTITISLDETYNVVVFMLDGVWHDLRVSLTDKQLTTLGTWDVY